MAKHTPGPWEYAQDELRPWRYSIYHNGPLCYTGDTTAQDGDGEANARLIAAAPDLLDACEIALNLAGAAILGEEVFVENNPHAGHLDVQWHLDKIRAAILKAAGGE